MAGDWIKMRVDLATSPKVVRISSALKSDRFATVGRLHAVWCLFDVHSVDGKLDGYTLSAIDEMIGCAGFGAAMVSVGWLEDCGNFLCVPRFDEHNGQSAKRRAMDTERKRAVRKTSAPMADKKRTREEKRREDSKPSVVSVADADKVPVKKDEIPDCPHEQIISLYAEKLPELPQPRIWEGKRQDHLRARWRWVITDLRKKGKACDQSAGVDFFGRLFDYVRGCPLLMGEKGDWNADLGWIVTADNFAKILQGNYERKDAAA